MEILPLVADQPALDQFLKRIRGAEFLAVDTEFMRENSYWPELCLIQAATPEVAAAIDPLAPDLDLEPLLEIMADERLLKVMHSGAQDIEIFHLKSGRVPQPLFDTQVAAMALGLGEQVSYANLVQRYCRASVDKGARFTDWARRPLSDRQLSYALGDVTWLARLFPGMLDELRRTGRGGWLDEEMGRLTDPATYVIEPGSAWRRLKLPSRKPDVLGRLKALAAWREDEARQRNIPRGRVLRDDTLGELAANPPATQADLARMRGLASSWATNDIGARLMAALQAAQPLSEEELPKRETARPGLSTEAQLIADLLKLYLKIRARESGVAPRLIARADELEALAGGQREGLPMLEGWRAELFGADALALVEGRLSARVVGGRLRMLPVED